MINAHIVYIRNEQNALRYTFALKRLIKRAVRTALIFEDYKKRAEVSVLLVSDSRIQKLNKTFRGIDRPTDVLSFPIDDKSGLLGDIVISLERAKAQAKEYGHSLEREIAFLCVHSVLHLLGYDHDEIPSPNPADTHNKPLKPQNKTVNRCKNKNVYTPGVWGDMFDRQRMILSLMGIER